jgi:hypothetical protein
MRAGYFYRKGTEMVDDSPDKKERKLIEKIKPIWEAWEKMNGNNIPLQRSFAGEMRDFDINLDGMAHYGMLPDLLQDMCNSGLTAEDLAPLFRSANDYVEMWEICQVRAKAIAGEREEAATD